MGLSGCRNSSWNQVYDCELWTTSSQSKAAWGACGVVQAESSCVGEEGRIIYPAGNHCTFLQIFLLHSLGYDALPSTQSSLHRLLLMSDSGRK